MLELIERAYLVAHGFPVEECLVPHSTWVDHPSETLWSCRLCSATGLHAIDDSHPSGSKTAAIDVSFTFADGAVSRSMSTTNATAAASRCLTDMLFVISIYKVLRTIFGVRMQDKHSSSAVAALRLYCKSRLLAAIWRLTSELRE